MMELKLDEAPYTIHNLPYGVLSTPDEPQPRTAVAVGHHAIDLAKYAKIGTLKRIEEAHNINLTEILGKSTLNAFAELSWDVRKEVRLQLQGDLQAQRVPAEVLVRLEDAILHQPMQTRGFSDFYTSLDHCKNCSGELTSKNIYKNWFHAPSVYNSRVSNYIDDPGGLFHNLSTRTGLLHSC